MSTRTIFQLFTVTLFAFSTVCPAAIHVVIDPPVLIESGIFAGHSRYTVHLVADQDWEKAVGWDGAVCGPLAQVWTWNSRLNAHMPTAYNPNSTDPELQYSDSHYLLATSQVLNGYSDEENDGVPIPYIPLFGYGDLEAAFAINVSDQQTDLPLCQITLAPGQTAILVGKAINAYEQITQFSILLPSGEPYVPEDQGESLESSGTPPEIIIPATQPSVNDFVPILPVSRTTPSLPTQSESTPAPRPEKRTFQYYQNSIKPLENFYETFAAKVPASSSKGNTRTLLDSETIIEVTGNITSNTIWEANNVYLVTTGIQVQALLVIEPGTTVRFGPNGYLFINNGGTLISCGTPDQLITYTSDAAEPYFGDYFCALYLDPTGSVSSQIRYSVVEYAFIGIYTDDLRLDEPIQNNYLSWCCMGIYEQGTHLTDLLNNQISICAGNPDPNCPAEFKGGAIYVDVVSYPAYNENPATNILIQNNTCDLSQYQAMTILGASSSANRGKIKILNNALTNSSYGILWFWEANLYPGHNGFFGNGVNRNFGDDDDFDDVIIPTGGQSPYESGVGPFDQYLLKTTCPFRNAGCGWVKVDMDNPQQYILTDGDISRLGYFTGSTTSLDQTPDTGIVDIGFHYPTFGQVTMEPPRADFNGDNTVNLQDLSVLATNYGHEGVTHSQGDANWDGKVDLIDLSTLATEYGQSGLQENPMNFLVNGQPVSANPVSGDVEIKGLGFTYNYDHLYLSLDGQLIGDILGFKNGNTWTLETNKLPNGDHELNLVGIRYDGQIGLSHVFTLPVQNTIHSIAASRTYNPTGSYHLGVNYSGTNTLKVKVLNYEDNEVWSQTITGTQVVIVPVSSLTEHVYSLALEERDGGNQLINSFIQTISEKCPLFLSPYIKVLVTICEDTNKLNEAATRRRNAVIKACRAKFSNSEIAVLTAQECTFENIGKILKNSQAKYWYNLSHGEYEVAWGSSETYRTSIIVWPSGPATFSDQLFSYKGTDIPFLPFDIGLWYIPLPAYFETYADTIGSLHLGCTSKIKIAFIDSCFSGRILFYDPIEEEIFNDMALALGMYSDDILPDQVYFGWYNEGVTGIEPDDTFVEKLWAVPPEMGLGAPYSVADALFYAYGMISFQPLIGDLCILGAGYQYYGYEALEIIYFRDE